MNFKLSDLEKFFGEVGAPFGHSEEMLPNSGITLTEAKTMYSLVRFFNIQRVLECGTHVGNSTWYLAEALKKNHGDDGCYIVTVDINQRPDCRVTNRPDILRVQSDAVEWMRSNDLSKFDYFNHDDEHSKVHIEAEIELIYPHRPKIITIHDSYAESRDFWHMVMNTPDYLPDYERHPLRSSLGMGVLIRK